MQTKQMEELNKISETKRSPMHINIPNGASTVKIFGISSNNRVFYDGSYNQYSGSKRTVVFTLGIYKKELDAPIKRVGFMGLDNGEPIHKESPPHAEYNNGLWDFEFNLYVDMMGMTKHWLKGAFYVETTNNTYYWLKNKKLLDFEFNYDSRFMLSDF